MPRRALTSDERNYVTEIFHDSVDPRRVRIARGSIAAWLSATTLGRTIHLQSRDFEGATMTLSDTGRATFMHEIAHVWQHQNGGWGYVVRSLLAQIKALLTKGTRNAAYDWLAAINAGVPWEKWNPEQQAECVACYGASWQRKVGAKMGPVDPPRPGDDAIVAMTAPFIALVRAGKGAGGRGSRK